MSSNEVLRPLYTFDCDFLDFFWKIFFYSVGKNFFENGSKIFFFFILCVFIYIILSPRLIKGLLDILGSKLILVTFCLIFKLFYRVFFRKIFLTKILFKCIKWSEMIQKWFLWCLIIILTHYDTYIFQPEFFIF